MNKQQKMIVFNQMQDRIEKAGYFVDANYYEAITLEHLSYNELVERVYNDMSRLIKDGITFIDACDYLHSIGKLNAYC